MHAIRIARAKKHTQHRLEILDYLRGLAVCAMIAFHQAWNMAYFGFLDINMEGGVSTRIAQVIGTSFLILVGISLHLSYTRSLQSASASDLRKRYLTRGLTILAWGLLISLVTAIVLPDDWVFFGILHLIGTSIMLSVLLLERRKHAWIPGLLLILLGYSPLAINSTSSWLIPLGIGISTRAMVDYYPIIPWTGVIFVGLSIGMALYPKGVTKQSLGRNRNNPLLKGLAFLGRNSLIVYLIHQPLLFALTYLSYLL